MGSDLAGWAVMGVALSIMWAAIMVLLNEPSLRPSPEALDCDQRGGYWSNSDGACHLTDSPAAGLAA